MSVWMRSWWGRYRWQLGFQAPNDKNRLKSIEWNHFGKLKESLKILYFRSHSTPVQRTVSWIPSHHVDFDPFTMDCETWQFNQLDNKFYIRTQSHVCAIFRFRFIHALRDCAREIRALHRLSFDWSERITLLGFPLKCGRLRHITAVTLSKVYLFVCDFILYIPNAFSNN